MPSSVVLADLAKLSIDARWTQVLELGHADLTRAVAALDPPHAALDFERLAWAVAFNLDAGFTPRTNAKPVVKRHRTPQTPWAAYWSAVSRPANGHEDPGTSLLCDLARSISCEHRNDWQRPGSPRIDVGRANAAFHAVRTRYERQIEAFARTLSIRGSDPETIAGEAWSYMFLGYWSGAAKNRFVGDSRIPTIVSTICRNLAANTIRRRESRADALSIDDESFDESSILTAPREDPVDRIAFERWRQQIRGCMERTLTAKQRMIAHLVWFDEWHQVDVVRKLGTTAENINQILTRAKKAVRACLGDKAAGISVLALSRDDEGR